MKTIGIILLWLGFIAGSLSTVMHSEAKGVKFVKGLTATDAEESRYDYVDLSGIEVPEDGWHLIPWSWYIPSALVCVLGAVMIQIASRSKGQKSDKTQSSLSEINAALDRAIVATQKLQKNLPGLAPSKIAGRIDDEIAEDLRVFADGRESIVVEFGLNCFADVMTNFAAGERSINRAWSAAADGYVDEAANCIERGIKLFQEAQSELSRSHKSTGE